MVWLYAMGLDPNLQVEQFVATLYGKALVIDWGLPDGQRCDWPCYSFSESDFFRHRAEIDGAVIVCPDGAMLCVNDMSLRYEAFIESRMAAIFAGAALDPRALEVSGAGIMVVRGDVDRRDEGAVCRYLTGRYGCKRPLRMPMQQVSAATRG